MTHAVLREGSPSRPPAIGAGLQVVDRLDGVKVDGVIVAIHPKLAPWVCQAALRQGLPVMVEKPAALSVGEAEALERAERESGRIVLVSHQHLFAEGFEAMRKMGVPISSFATWGGPEVHDFPHAWDYGPHAAAATLALGARIPMWVVLKGAVKTATVQAIYDDDMAFTYDAYASQAELPLTRAVRAFAQAIRDGGTEDYRFGAHWAADVARSIEATVKPSKLS